MSGADCVDDPREICRETGLPSAEWRKVEAPHGVDGSLPSAFGAETAQSRVLVRGGGRVEQHAADGFRRVSVWWAVVFDHARKITRAPAVLRLARRFSA